MPHSKYLMESPEEVLRLDLKTDNKVTEKQALWAGIKPGMRIADVGCGSGKTTSRLYELVQPGGTAVGIDIAEQRILFAKEHYGVTGIEFKCRDAREPLEDLGMFDFVWVRFLLEYYRSNSFDMVKNISRLVKPGGIMCLIDLDHNCLSHFGISEKMERTIHSAMKVLENKANFDPYVGRKLYSYLYDLGFQDIDTNVAGHHVIFGELKESDAFNWMRKVEVAPKKIGFQFSEYEGGYEEFLDEFKRFFADPRRFTYSPIISCRGRRPVI
ncbi:MAG: type 11 [Geobacteraceae bacterium]|nr:MAG: type 11 [Geobacteraceae bacterium]